MHHPIGLRFGEVGRVGSQPLYFERHADALLDEPEWNPPCPERHGGRSLQGLIEGFLDDSGKVGEETVALAAVG